MTRDTWEGHRQSSTSHTSPESSRFSPAPCYLRLGLHFLSLDHLSHFPSFPGWSLCFPMTPNSSQFMQQLEHDKTNPFDAHFTQWLPRTPGSQPLLAHLSQELHFPPVPPINTSIILSYFLDTPSCFLLEASCFVSLFVCFCLMCLSLTTCH